MLTIHPSTESYERYQEFVQVPAGGEVDLGVVRLVHRISIPDSLSCPNSAFPELLYRN